MSKAAELAALIGSQTAQSNRNMIINGAMQVAQRATSSTSFFYASVDRFQFSKNATDNLAMTQSQDSDNPAGQGFGSSFKVNITTAESALDADENINFHQRIEGQNLQRLEKGTSNAKSSTVSFWVKSNTTGTYVLELFDNDNSRHAAKTYTIDSANTWEKKIITFAGDTTGALDNDANRSLDVRWWLAAGSNFTSGTLPTGWASLTTANRAVGQVNLMASTNNWYITGIQWELGDVATAFEHRSFGDELARCQRYYQQFEYVSGSAIAIGATYSSSAGYAGFPFLKEMRAAPSITLPTAGQSSGNATFIAGGNQFPSSTGTNTAARINKHSFTVEASGYSGLTTNAGSQYYSVGATTLKLDAEL